MQAIGVIPSERRIALLSHPLPEIVAANQIKVRTIEVGVCGTDREIASFGYGAPPQGTNYLILGHEALGQVVEVGSGVTRFKAGEFVVPSVRRPCQDRYCSSCMHDRQDFCSTNKFTERGIKEAHGFMTEYFVEEEQYLYRVPEHLRDVAVLTEPLTIAEKAIDQIFQIQRRLPWHMTMVGGLTVGTAVVLGAGPIGLLGALAFVLRGFRTFVYSRSAAPNSKSELCEAFGATYLSSAVVGLEEFAERVGRIDVVYEALGAADISFEIIKRLGPNGVFVFTGIPPEKPAIPVQADALMHDMVLKNQVIVGTVNADSSAFENAIRDLGECRIRWPNALGQMITGRHPMSAYKELLVGRHSGIKDVITLSS